MYHRGRAKAREGASFALPAAVLLRISAVLAIHKALSGLFDATEAVAWLREPHGAPIFGGQPPLTRITEGTQEGPLLALRSEERTSELQSLMRISYAVFCLKKKKRKTH